MDYSCCNSGLVYMYITFTLSSTCSVRSKTHIHTTLPCELSYSLMSAGNCSQGVLAISAWPSPCPAPITMIMRTIIFHRKPTLQYISFSLCYILAISLTHSVVTPARLFYYDMPLIIYSAHSYKWWEHDRLRRSGSAGVNSVLLKMYLTCVPQYIYPHAHVCIIYMIPHS